MKKGTKIALIVALSCIVVGIILTGVGFAAGIKYLGYDKYSQYSESYNIPSNAIKLDVDVTDVNMYVTEGDKVTVDYYDTEEKLYEITADDSSIIVKRKYEKKKWWQNIGIFMGSFNDECYKVSIGIPKEFAGDIEIDGTVGDIDINGIDTAGNIIIDCTVGSVDLRNVTAENIEIDTTTGDIDFNNIFGRKSVKIEATVGDIDGVLAGSKSDYTIESDTTLGDNNLKHEGGNGSISLKVNTTTGDIDVDFAD